MHDTCRIKFINNINKRRIKLDAMKYIPRTIYIYIYIYDPTPIVKDSIFLLDENIINFINKAAV